MARSMAALVGDRLQELGRGTWMCALRGLDGSVMSLS